SVVDCFFFNANFFFSSRRRHTRFSRDWSSDVCSSDLVPNWLIATPDPNVAVGHLCDTFKVEMVIRGYMSGHAAREYKVGKRMLCGVAMPEGMKENDKFPHPIITPATKAEMGDHDEDISREDIIKKGIVAEADYIVLEDYTRKLFQRG